MNESTHSTNQQATSNESLSGNRERRNFLFEFATIAIGAVISLFGFFAGLIVFLDPLTRKEKVPLAYREAGSSGDGFIRVASLESLPDDGIPRRFPVIADQIDAWTFTPAQPIGAVFMRREKGKGNDDIQVFHATCPHAGCAVSFTSDTSEFRCPCHNSAFDVNGQKIALAGKENPSPRPMDRLEYKVDDEGNIYVQFVNYYTGIHDKVEKI